MSSSEIKELKCILVGESGTGKTCLINSLLGSPLNPEETPTLSPSFAPKTVKIGEKSYKVNIWDTMGQEKYRALTKVFIKDSKLVFLVYDITDRESFEKLNCWYNTIIDALGENVVIGFIANKQDLYRDEKVRQEEIEKYANEKNAAYRYTSALNPASFEEFFQEQVKAYDDKTKEIVENVRGTKLNTKKHNKSKKWC